MAEVVRDILQNKGTAIFAVGPVASVLDAVRLMNAQHCGSVLVMDDGHVLGIFSERDVLMRVVAKGRNPKTTRVREVMTENLRTVGPDTTILEAMRIVTRERCRHLPVFEGSQLIGLVSIGDLTKTQQMDLRREVRQLSNYIGGPYLS